MNVWLLRDNLYWMEWIGPFHSLFYKVIHHTSVEARICVIPEVGNYVAYFKLGVT